MSGEVLIEFSGVEVMWEGGTSPLLHDVNWRIARSECWVVGGAPGSGRTSLLATAAGLDRPGAGRLHVFGRDLAEASEEEQVDWRRRMGFVYENGGRLLGHLSVAANVALPMRYHLDLDEAQVDQRVEQLLTRTGTLPYAGTMPSRLNVRLQQRAGLARALAVPSEVLFLDNPLTGLSPRDARWWTEYLHELRHESAALTIVATCDDFHPWLDLATHFGVIDDGRFRVLGGRDQVLASEEPVVRELL